MRKTLILTLVIFGMIFISTGCGGGGSDNNITERSKDNPSIAPQASVNNNTPKANLPKEFPVGEFGEIKLTADYVIPKEALFLDIRNPWERDRGYAKGSIGGAVYEFRVAGDESQDELNVDFIDEVLALSEVNNDRSRYIILICSSSSRTKQASQWLSTSQDETWEGHKGGGFTRVYHILGGFHGGKGEDGWEKMGLEVVNGSN